MSIRCPVRVLTWNLYHGRAVPPAGRVAAAASSRPRSPGWEWDVALLQEVPPWWPARARGARAAPTQRHGADLAQLAAAAAPRGRERATRPPEVQRRRRERDPRARGAIARAPLAVLLRRRPSAASSHGVRLADGTWVVNLHAQHTPPERGAGRHRARRGPWRRLGGRRAARPRRRPQRRADRVLAGLRHARGDGVDHVLVRAGSARPRREVLDRGALSRPPAGRRDAARRD